MRAQMTISREDAVSGQASRGPRRPLRTNRNRACWLGRLALVAVAVLTGTTWASVARAQGDTWISLGPEGGGIAAFAMDPVTPTTVYAGTGGGLFKSVDGGRSWTASNTGLTSTTVYALAVDPVTPTTVYAGPVSAGCSEAPMGVGAGRPATPA